MKIEDIISQIEKFAPLSTQESWDNSGIQIKSHNSDIKKIILCLDVTEEVLDCAIKNKANLIISHHPLFFNSIKSIFYEDILGKIIIKAIQNKINIVSLHTNIDSSRYGLADYFSKKLGLINLEVLEPINIKSYKIVTFIPEDYIDKFLNFFVENDISIVENYKACSFSINGIGTFYPYNNANPFIGEKNKINKINEYRVEIVSDDLTLNKVISKIKEIHPYETPLIDVYELKNRYNNYYGLGRIGEFSREISFEKLLTQLKDKFLLKYLRYVGDNLDRKVKRVAVCPGSGMSLLKRVLSAKVDVYITGDVKYHEAFNALNNGIYIVDIGHFESEIWFIDLMKSFLSNLNLEIIEFPQKNIFKIK